MGFKNLKVTILSLPDYFNDDKKEKESDKRWGIKIGETYPVIQMNQDLGKGEVLTGYLIQGILPLTVYSKEVEISQG